MDYNIQTQKYEGPLDLLLDLITRKKINISEISIIEITEQYLSYVDEMEEVDLELASDFISMASKLLEIKSRYILYVKNSNPEESDPREELFRQLEEYQKYKQITELLIDGIDEYDKRYYRKIELELEDDDVSSDLTNITIELIEELLPKIFPKEKKKENTSNNEKLETIVKKPIIHVEEKIQSIRKYLESENGVYFDKILLSCDKDEKIANFLAILELIKMKEIVIVQDKFLDKILIKKN
ncbi:segregation and condensation protein A [Peptostreptococcus porci]|uniref:segregation and condensation protein A n=1 Tax=Peptostreptococcus porci TaxID=2652282 RepID=UPI0023F406BD|nr:segregation/condensation protein A [Peptostreptococcus porci]MDD7182339.1 segregation/condensation protein A [Peptostreptococcus porci]MDY2794062.1 segregation/condensation protein A [Peptostreptococcus porci]MDY4561234.1 segregation/condensation protein A [Peptostreptococcus porci]MDY5435453.1 segregation/condensation protein A [Peptostreptococcus porci]MDY5479662.1 segregation/condensation protein A [Peptostreptococcus porci]